MCRGPSGGLSRGSTPIPGRQVCPHDLGLGVLLVFLLVRCQIHMHGEGKGTWRRDTEREGTWTWRPLPSEPMSPVFEGIGVGSLSSLNLCGDPRGVRFGTAHFLVALQHWVLLVWCTQWRQGKRVDFTVQWTAVVAGARPVYDPAVLHQYAGTGADTRTTPTAFATWAVPASATPPSRAHVMGDLVEAPTAYTLLRTAMGSV